MYEQQQEQQQHHTQAQDQALCALQGSQHAAQSMDNRRYSATSSSTMTLPQSILTNPAIQPSSVINLSNSTDVVIGPMTQYQGPVSIYYMDASMQTAATRMLGINNSSRSNSNSSSRDSSSSENINETRSRSRRSNKSKRLTRNTLLLCLIVLLVLITAIVIVYVELNRARGEHNANKSIYFGNSYEDGPFPNLGKGHLVVDRKQWGASDEKLQQLTVPLHYPIPYVLITHVGVQSQPCGDIYKCSIKMRTIQDSAIAEKHLPDIQSNFYVSNEGHIYTGRGWEWANTYANHTLAITFMGDYGRYTPSAKQLEGVQFLLAHAVANRRLDVDYKLVAQSQTKKTRSPGINVYREISKWPHFYACSMEHEPQCGTELGMTAASWKGMQ